MGKMAKPAGAVTVAVNGLVNGKPVALNLSHPLPAPLVEHFFLNLMVHQWRNAPHKDAPAMLQSDRALALASTQVKLYRDEFLTQAVWAVSVDRLDEAEKLYNAALKVDPTDKEAVSGSSMVARMRAGKLTKAELTKRVALKTGAIKVGAEEIRAFVQEPGAVDPPAPPAPGGPAATPPNPAAAADIVKEAAARRQIEEQRYKVLTDATIRRGRSLLRTDPDAAYQDLKRQRDDILAYDALGRGRPPPDGGRPRGGDARGVRQGGRDQAAGRRRAGGRRPRPPAAQRVRPGRGREGAGQEPHRPVPPADAAGPVRAGLPGVAADDPGEDRAAGSRSR